MTRVYMIRGISAVKIDSPVIETRAAKTARLGMVYRIPEMPLISG